MRALCRPSPKEHRSTKVRAHAAIACALLRALRVAHLIALLMRDASQLGPH